MRIRSKLGADSPRHAGHEQSMVDLRLIGLDISGVEKVAILGKRNGCCQLVTFRCLEILEPPRKSLPRDLMGFQKQGHPIAPLGP